MTTLIDDRWSDTTCTHLGGDTFREFKDKFSTSCGCNIAEARRNGTLPMLPYSATHLRINRPVGHMIIPNYDPFCLDSSYAGVDIGRVKNEDITYVDARAVRSLYNRLPDGHPDVGVIVAESREAVTTVADRAISIAKAFNALRYGDWRTAMRALGNPGLKNPGKRGGRLTPKEALDWASNAWLEWTYGWSPLVSDVHSIVNELSGKFVLNKHHFATIHTTCHRKFDPVVSGSSVASFTTKGHHKVRVSYTARVMYNSEGYQQPVAYGVTDPGHIAWEKLPYSFVVDWFVPVGDWLRALTFEYSKSLTWGDICRSEKLEDDISVDISQVRWSVNRQWYNAVALKTDLMRREFHRTIPASPPSANLILDAKRFEDASNIYHWISAFALMKNAFSGSGRPNRV